MEILVLLAVLSTSPELPSSASACSLELLSVHKRQSRVHLHRKRGEVTYSQTERSLSRLSQEWAAAWADLDALKANGPLLDVGCGHGGLVKELTRAGVDAEGLDIALPEPLKRDPRFFERDAIRTELSANRYGTILVSYSLFTFEDDEQLHRLALLELHRITKPGGVIRLGPVHFETALSAALKQVEGLTLNNPVPGREWLPKWVELKKAEAPSG